MRSIASEINESVQQWLAPIGILALTVIAVKTVRWLIQRAGHLRHFTWLEQLARPLSNLIYVVGLWMFLEAAPLHPRAGAWVQHAVYVLGVLILLQIVRRAALLGMEWSAIRNNQSATLQQGFLPMMRNVITLFVFFTGAIMILKHFGYDVLSLLTALGVGSLAFGLAAKDTLANMISGFTLIIDRNLGPGDRINLAGSTGEVEEIGLRSTRIRTGNGNTLIVPNSELVNTKILNLSHPTRAISVSSTIRVPVSVPFSRVREISLACVGQVEKAIKEKGQFANLASLDGGAQVIQVGFWVADLDHEGSAISDLNERLLARLTQERIPLMGAPAPVPAAP